MATLSQNGWSAIPDRTGIVTYTVPGTQVKLPLRQGDAATLLLYVASRFDKEVENIDVAEGHSVPDDWGYAYRNIRGATRLSNHSSGTAMDLNATQHPLGTTGNFTAAQVTRIHKILSATGGTVRWGGDYSGRKDPMHFEVNATAAQVRAALKKLKLPLTDNPLDVYSKTILQVARKKVAYTLKRVLAEGVEGNDVKKLQKKLKVVPVDGIFGPDTAKAVEAFQKAHKLEADGMVGATTAKALGWKFSG